MFMHFPSRHLALTSGKPQKGRQGAASCYKICTKKNTKIYHGNCKKGAKEQRFEDNVSLMIIPGKTNDTKDKTETEVLTVKAMVAFNHDIMETQSKDFL